jgi:hypothetical protein
LSAAAILAIGTPIRAQSGPETAIPRGFEPTDEAFPSPIREAAADPLHE